MKIVEDDDFINVLFLQIDDLVAVKKTENIGAHLSP